MSINVGIGYSDSPNSYEAGIEAATKAIENGKIINSKFAMLFCGSKHNPNDVLKGVRSLTGDAQIIGGSSVGIITNDNLAYEGYEIGITLIETDELSFRIYSQKMLNTDEYQAGKELAEKLEQEHTGNEKALFVFYDSFKSFEPPSLNYATFIFRALEENYKGIPAAAGAGLFPDLTFKSPCYQFFNSQVLQHHLVALVIEGNCRMDTTIIHGCKPMSSYKTITKAEGPVIFEIDNKPALEVIDEILGEDNDMEWKDYALFVTLGLNKGDKFGEYVETDYASRLVLSVDVENKALIMFEPDLKPGDEVQLMRRSVDLNYIQISVDSIMKNLGDRKPILALYIDCLGRAQRYCGSMFEEGTEIQKTVGMNFPLLGFYSGVEVAKVGNNMQPLDWTAVLCLITN